MRAPAAVEDLHVVARVAARADRPHHLVHVRRVDVIVHNDDKLGGCLIDAEIAGQRTMISYRPDLTVKNLRFRADGVEFKNVRIAPFKK